MDINDDFQAAVITAIYDRQAKMRAIVSGVESFLDQAIESHKLDPIDNMYADTYEKRDNGFDKDAYTGVMYRSSKKGENSTTLGISISSSGKVSVSFTGDEFGDNPREEAIAKAVATINGEEPEFKESEVRKFDFDGYKPEEAVAKILTIIQDVDICDFGQLIEKTMERMRPPYSPPPSSFPAGPARN